MSLDEYIESLKNKRVTVVGAGISNRPLIKLLCANGVNVTVCDRSETLHEELQGLPIHTNLGENYLDALDADIIFRTPGLHPDAPALRKAREDGCELTSEMELFLRLCPCRAFAVTGSDGKTTTTSLVAALLKEAGYRVHLGGNIGHPLLCETPDIQPDDIAVLELSSFQLHSMVCHPDVAVITNMSPNHLDVHPNYADYIDAKKQIFRHQAENGLLVVNEDNEISLSCAAEAKGVVRSFSRRHPVQNGFYCDESGMIIQSQNGERTKLMSATKIPLPGVHNLENVLAALTAVNDLVDREAMISAVQGFTGVAHRLETVRVHKGVTYINDSIASSPGRTIAGLRCFEKKVILVAGGKDKGLSFDESGPEICKHVKSLYVTGMTAEKIRQATQNAENYSEALPIHVMEDFRETVLAAAAEAEEGDVVLLSPASTSFDKFANFEERGNTFRRIVEAL